MHASGNSLNRKRRNIKQHHTICHQKNLISYLFRKMNLFVYLLLSLLICSLTVCNNKQTMARKSQGQKSNNPRTAKRRMQHAVRKAKKDAAAKIRRDFDKSARMRKHRENLAKQATRERAQQM